MDAGMLAEYTWAMELILLKTLVVVSEMGGFTAAADRLCVTQSAVSRRIQQLESYYGVQLLTRAPDPLALTPQGRILVNKSRRILAMQEEMDEAVTGLTAPRQLRLCCTPCFGITRLPQILKTVAGNMADTDYQVSFRLSEEIVNGLLTGRCDLAGMEYCCDLHFASCRVFPLPGDRMVFVSSPASGIPKGSVPIEALAEHRLIFKSEKGCAHRFLARSLEKSGRDIDEFRRLAFYDDLAGLVQQVVAGQGISFVSRELVADEIQEGTLVTHEIEGLDQVRPRSLILAPHFLVDDVTRDFLAVFFESFALPIPEGVAG